MGALLLILDVNSRKRIARPNFQHVSQVTHSNYFVYILILDFIKTFCCDGGHQSEEIGRERKVKRSMIQSSSPGAIRSS
jgi:hypothetical protein